MAASPRVETWRGYGGKRGREMAASPQVVMGRGARWGVWKWRLLDLAVEEHIFGEKHRATSAWFSFSLYG